MFLLQPVRKPVPDEDAPVGEHLAGGGHLLVHVPPLPYPLCGTTANYLPDHTSERDAVADGIENLPPCHSAG